MTNAELFDSWKGLDDHKLSIELARVTGEMLVVHREELVARIHAIIRRSKGHAQSVIRVGKVLVNLDAKTVDVEGRTVHLTGKEYQMLELHLHYLKVGQCVLPLIQAHYTYLTHAFLVLNLTLVQLVVMIHLG